MNRKVTAFAVSAGLVAAIVGVPVGAAHAAGGTSKLGVYELSVTTNGSGVFDQTGEVGTMRFKTAPSSQIPAVEVGAGQAEQYYLTLPAGMEFAPGAERSGLCGLSSSVATVNCRMESNRRYFYIDITFRVKTQRAAASDPWVSFPVRSTGRITGTARAIYKPAPNVKTEAPCTTAYVPADAEPEAFDVIKALSKAYPNQNLNTDDLLMNVRSSRIVDSKLDQSEVPAAKGLDTTNDSPLQQTWSTYSKTVTITSTATVTNEHKSSTAGKTGGGFKLTIMELFETSVNWEIGFSAENTKTNTETKTTSESVTYQPQALNMPPHSNGRLDYLMTRGRSTGKIETVGEYAGKIGVSNCDGSNWRSVGTEEVFQKAAGFLPSWVHRDGTFTWMSTYSVDAAVRERISAKTWPIGTEPTSKLAKSTLTLVKNNADITLNKR